MSDAERYKATVHRNGHRTSARQAEALNAELGYDDGDRFAVVAVTGYEIVAEGPDPFGTIFSLIDTDTGDEVDVSTLVDPAEVRHERRHWIARARHLNGREDE